MRRIATAAFVFVLWSAASYAQSLQSYIVGTRTPAFEAARQILSDDLPRRADRAPVHAFRSVNAFAVELTWDEAQALKKSPRVSYVEEDVERHILADSVTPGSETTPYGVTMVDAPQVWPVTKGKGLNGAPATHVVVIDTGISYNNPELAPAYKGGFNTLNNTNDPFDDHGHGTHVAGTIAAAMNGTGVVGVAPDVDLYSVKVLNSCGSGPTSKIIDAIDWAIGKKKEIGGNWILSLSLGSDAASDSEEIAFQTAADNGILTFAASGNSYDGVQDGLAFPAAYSSVVSVGAVDSAMKVAEFSQRGAGLKIVAPGVEVLSTFPGNQIASSDGRSFEAFAVEESNTSGAAICATASVVTSEFVDCGSGNLTEFPLTVSGKIALIERGGTSIATGSTLTFTEKGKNAKAAGAIATVIYNNRATDDPPGWAMTNLTSAGQVPVVNFAVTQATGAAIKSNPGTTLTLSFGRETFALLQGTSMATPHASAVGALVWAVAPGATNEQVKLAIINTARDLGTPGFDTTYGFGLVDALAAAKALNPAAFNPQPPIGRRSLRRGH